MKKIINKTYDFHFNVILIHSLIGILIGIFVFHPITMAIYWFEFNPSNITLDTLVKVFMARVNHSFNSNMLAMSLIFASIGGILGFISGLYSKALRLKNILSEKNDQLIEIDNIKSNFLHLISHEIRTPLNGIIGFVSILKNMDTTSDFRRIVDMLESSATRLEKFSLTALKITELRTNSKIINSEKINLLEKVRFVLSSYKEKIIQKQVAVIISPRLNDGQTYAFVNTELFYTCIDHVLMNALQFCEKSITIDGWEDSSNSYTILEISNDGKWFSKLTESNVFNLLGSKTTHLVGFNGLDFPLIKLICEAHNGNVEIRNTPESGDTVRLYFPNVIN